MTAIDHHVWRAAIEAGLLNYAVSIDPALMPVLRPADDRAAPADRRPRASAEPKRRDPFDNPLHLIF